MVAQRFFLMYLERSQVDECRILVLRARKGSRQVFGPISICAVLKRAEIHWMGWLFGGKIGENPSIELDNRLE